ncbi:hypothetical protein OBBRIDRAFT_314726 [Obba rivulosa]|uniref:Sodium/calcium exchanger membrane region domain-containing protein n=1 Tax=Obba rivulosa TaxID=1052685 RepID=A0A8E2AP41_9APHY|nr:hypothetical protein OBBRIDRAFT_314726 [Obba rivulosa]
MDSLPHSRMSTSIMDLEEGSKEEDNKEEGNKEEGKKEEGFFYHAHSLKQFAEAVSNRNKQREVRFTIARSIRGIIASSPMNVLLLCVPLAWFSHFHPVWGHTVTYSLCFTSIIPLERMFDWGGEQMAYYLGEELGDLLIITLNNAVEATLAFILLAHCELRLLQSTIVGVIILHLLLVPGMSFLAGGMQSWQQGLMEHTTELNHSLLMLGVLSIMLPTALFAALDRGAVDSGSQQFSPALVNDRTRGQILIMSRGLSILLIIM